MWSLWSKPLSQNKRDVWLSPRHHLFAWALSFEAARRHYPETCLVTDDEGARLLVDQLGLPFGHVSTALNDLKDADPGWWSLGKLRAYRAQSAPFVHLDADVFLWKPLPERLERAAVFAQSPEPFRPGASCYRPALVERALGYPERGWLPPEWVWFRRRRRQRGDCCGIFGGARLDFIRHYADSALRLIDDPANGPGWARFDDKVGNMILPEQYFLSACVDYHRAAPDSPFGGVRIEHLFVNPSDAHDPERVKEAGYTHLIGDAKRNPAGAERLENRLRRDHPELHARCLSVGDAAKGSAASSV